MQKIIHKENEVLLCRLQWPVSVKQTQSNVLVEMKRQDVFWQILDLLQERKLLYCRRSEAM